MIKHYIGIDPGPTPGFVMLTPRGRHIDTDVIQCTAHVAATILWTLLDQCRAYQSQAPAIVAMERFVTRGRTNAAQRQTLDQVGKLQQTAANEPLVDVVLRNASQVKAWATDDRLAAAGLLDLCKGMRHSRDAARHALFAAVHDGGLPDPLSKTWTHTTSTTTQPNEEKNR